MIYEVLPSTVYRTLLNLLSVVVVTASRNLLRFDRALASQTQVDDVRRRLQGLDARLRVNLPRRVDVSVPCELADAFHGHAVLVQPR